VHNTRRRLGPALRSTVRAWSRARAPLGDELTAAGEPPGSHWEMHWDGTGEELGER
jgi:hypothetical protein